MCKAANPRGELFLSQACAECQCMSLGEALAVARNGVCVVNQIFAVGFPLSSAVLNCSCSLCRHAFAIMKVAAAVRFLLVVLAVTAVAARDLREGEHNTDCSVSLSC